MEDIDAVKEKIVVYTDASYDSQLEIATYGIVVEKDDQIMKQFSKKLSCKVSSSTEAEVYGIYQAMCLINSTYLNKNVKQKIRIKTDCTSAKKFFTNDNEKKMFSTNPELYVKMKNLHKNLKRRIHKDNGSFKIKWLPREKNLNAHIISKEKLRVHKKEILGSGPRNISIRQETFYKVLLDFSDKERTVFSYLLTNAGKKGNLMMTQNEISQNLQFSLSFINKTMKKLMDLFLLRKVGNGRYKVLVLNSEI